MGGGFCGSVVVGAVGSVGSCPDDGGWDRVVVVEGSGVVWFDVVGVWCFGGVDSVGGAWVCGTDVPVCEGVEGTTIGPPSRGGSGLASAPAANHAVASNKATARTEAALQCVMPTSLTLTGGSAVRAR